MSNDRNFHSPAQRAQRLAFRTSGLAAQKGMVNFVDKSGFSTPPRTTTAQRLAQRAKLEKDLMAYLDAGGQITQAPGPTISPSRRAYPVRGFRN